MKSVHSRPISCPLEGEVGGGGGGGGGGGDSFPEISNVVSSSVSYTTASFSWSASDNLGVSASSFVYGTSISYGSSGTVTGNYQTSLSGLATGTLYYFKISAVDTGNQTTEYTGTFSTLTAPPVADTTPPIISNVQVDTSITTATIQWTTDESADTQLNYGLTGAYGSNYFDVTGALNHSVPLVNLLPSTTYHFQIVSTDASGNSASTVGDVTFVTKPDNVPPPDVSNFSLSTTTTFIVLSWTNPSLVGTPDFTNVLIVRKVDSPSLVPGDGTAVYTGTGTNFTDTNVIENINYFYTIFSFDTSNNNSPGIFRNGQIVPIIPPTPPSEICGNSLDDDSNGQIDCADSACALLPQCIVTPPPTSTSPGPEICDNNIDDDNNNRQDCADPACVGFSGCVVENQVAKACNNGLDDDGDGKIDHGVDPGCDNADDNDEYNPPEPTVPEFIKLDLNKLIFFGGNRQIILEPISDAVTGLSGTSLTVAVPEVSLFGVPQTMILHVGNTDAHQFVYSSTDKRYYADLFFNKIGLTQAYIEIDYGSDQLDSVGFQLNSLYWGQITDKDEKGLAGVSITLYGQDGGIFEMGNFGQLNPVASDINGNFGWLVPNGDFKISLEKNGYYSRSVSINDVRNHVINPQLNLIAKPVKLELKIDPKESLPTNIKNITVALTGQTKILSTVAVQVIQDVANNPEVEKVNEEVVVPTAVTAVVVGALSFVSWLDFLPFLRLLFLQPLMLLGWRKREKWGLVYNSLNKMPIGLAMVRLLNAETNKVLQSKVTDSKGRFIFMVAPGKYKLSIQKNKFIFPSKFLEGFQSDGQRVDIYHGETIEVKNSTSITATIPLDPVEATKRPGRLFWQKVGRNLQTALSVIGILVTGASLYVSPKWYIVGLLVVHIVVFFIFRKLAVPSKPKNWGFVYDDSSRAPVSRVIARLFNSQFNKLVDTQVTDSAGKYYFIAGDAKYYVTYEHKEYHPQKSEIIDLEGKEAEAITVDAKLKKH